MRNKWIVIGVIIFIILLIIGFTVLNIKKIFDKSSLDLNAESLKNEEVLNDVNIETDIDIEFKNMYELYPNLTENEIKDLEVKLIKIFSKGFPEYASIRSNYNNYYNQNSEDIKTMSGIESEETFIRLMNKLNRIPSYKKCIINLQANSIEVINKNYFVNFRVIYDDTTEVEYFTIIDLETLDIAVK